MNNTALGILSTLFILIGSWMLSWANFFDGTADSPTSFLFTDGAFKTKGVDAFSFEKSGSFLTVPVATNGEFKKIAAHFKSNENRTLSLVGNYYASEKYTGDTNLGKERAEAVKKKLEKYGVPGERVITSGKELTGKMVGKKLYNAVIFEGNEKVEEEKVEVEKPFSVLDRFTVRFETGKSSPKMTDELKNYIDEAIIYINENPDKTLMIIGYTDNMEKSQSKLSKRRAEIVRSYFRKNNKVDRKYIKYEGKGMSNEIEPNDTEEGRALNRRVEITIE